MTPNLKNLEHWNPVFSYSVLWPWGGEDNKHHCKRWPLQLHVQLLILKMDYVSKTMGHNQEPNNANLRPCPLKCLFLQGQAKVPQLTLGGSSQRSPQMLFEDPPTNPTSEKVCVYIYNTHIYSVGMFFAPDLAILAFLVGRLVLEVQDLMLSTSSPFCRENGFIRSYGKPASCVPRWAGYVVQQSWPT